MYCANTPTISILYAFLSLSFVQCVSVTAHSTKHSWKLSLFFFFWKKMHIEATTTLSCINTHFFFSKFLATKRETKETNYNSLVTHSQCILGFVKNRNFPLNLSQFPPRRMKYCLDLFHDLSLQFGQNILYQEQKVSIISTLLCLIIKKF